MKALLASLWVLSLFAQDTFAQDAERIFTGVWNLEAEESVTGALSFPPAPVLRIDHQGESITCADGQCSLSTDGKQTRRQLPNEVRSTSVVSTN
jgi:hypothetical protein